LAGRYLVLIPFTNVISISKKINSQEERKRLLRLVESIRPKNFGVILRTLAEGKSVQDLHEDMVHLFDKWKLLTRELKAAEAPKATPKIMKSFIFEANGSDRIIKN
jgi:ribonuclease G